MGTDFFEMGALFFGPYWGALYNWGMPKSFGVGYSH